MPMRYADRNRVLKRLKLEADNPAHASAIQDVEQLENGLCAVFDEKIGTSFGTAPEPVTREVVLAAPSPRLIASVGIRSVIDIETGGTWDGSTWLDGELVAVPDYRLTLLDHTGLYWGIDHLAGTWSGTVRVTGIWADQPELLVPDDVREALTFITVDEYRMRTSSPAGEIGPDGLVVPVRNPWKYESVQTAIARHRIVRMVV